MSRKAVIIALLAAGGAFNLAVRGQIAVLSDTFDAYTSGAFGGAYNYGDSAANPSSIIVSPGAGGIGQALQFSANLHSGTNSNAGVNLPAYTPIGNTSTSLSDYTLSFDLAINGANPGGFYVALNTFGPGGADGVEYDLFTLPPAGSGFQHYAVNMGTLPHAYNVPILNPVDSQYQIQLVLLGFPPGVTATPETVLLDNLQITMAPNTNAAAPSYLNPPIYADYPDPDIIRVSNDFYFATTTFVNVPGLTLLHSQDLVHWEIVSHVVSQLSGSPNYNITNGVANYRNGIFAPSLRYRNGTFYVVVTPNGQNTRIYYASDIHGPWQYNQLNVSAFDPGFYIETNGTGYIATAGGWQNLTTFLTLNSSFSQVVASTSITNNLGLEGSKVIKRGGYYYIFNAQPSTESLYVSRATNLFGPYTFMKMLDDGRGGHQGAIVDLPDGTDYGFVMKDSGAIGRMTFISPIIWSNNWPVWGLSNAPGRVPSSAPMPIVGAPAYSIPASDDFSSPTLNLQWQWNHNPDNTRWSLASRPGFLRLYPTGATNFWFARNTLIQKGRGAYSSGEVKFDLSHLQPADICGFGTLGKTNGNISVVCGSDGSLTLSMNISSDTDGTGTNLAQSVVATAPFAGPTLYLRTTMDFVRNKGLCSYSSDGVIWTTLGGPFNLSYDWATGTFQGEQYAIFCYNPQPGTGYVDVDWFRMEPPAFIADIVADLNSNMKLHLESSPNSTNLLQMTSDLSAPSSWQTISTNVADGNGVWQFSDTDSASAPVRFYRSLAK